MSETNNEINGGADQPAVADAEHAAKVKRTKHILFVVTLVAIVGFFYFLGTLGRVVPLPRDEDHIAAETNEMCRECHGVEAGSPLSRHHPPKEQCLICHRH